MECLAVQRREHQPISINRTAEHTAQFTSSQPAMLRLASQACMNQNVDTAVTGSVHFVELPQGQCTAATTHAGAAAADEYLGYCTALAMFPLVSNSTTEPPFLLNVKLVSTSLPDCEAVDLPVTYTS